MVKHLNSKEANQLAVYKRGRGFELRTTAEPIQLLAFRAGTRGLQITSPAL